MPIWANEKLWKQAKAIFISEYGHKPKSKRDYKIVMGIYERIAHYVPKSKKKTKKRSRKKKR